MGWDSSRGSEDTRWAEIGSQGSTKGRGCSSPGAVGSCCRAGMGTGTESTSWESSWDKECTLKRECTGSETRGRGSTSGCCLGTDYSMDMESMTEERCKDRECSYQERCTGRECSYQEPNSGRECTTTGNCKDTAYWTKGNTMGREYTSVMCRDTECSHSGHTTGRVYSTTGSGTDTDSSYSEAPTSRKEGSSRVAAATRRKGRYRGMDSTSALAS